MPHFHRSVWTSTILATSAAVLTIGIVPSEARKIKVADDPVKGAAAASLVLIEFADFQCGACARAAQETMPAILDDYVVPGRLAIVFVDLPLEMHPQAFPAAVAAQCAGRQGRFWAYHEKLFAAARILTPEDYPRFAQALGLDSASFAACLDDPDVADAVREDIDLAESLGIRGTPSFLLARRKVGDAKLEILDAIEGGSLKALRERIEARLAGR